MAIETIKTMERPRTYHIFKKDRARHKYDYTHEAHGECLAYEQYLDSIKGTRLIVSNLEIAKVFNKVKKHCKNLKEQPITIDFIGTECDNSKIVITSVEGKVEFELWADKRDIDITASS